MFYLHIILCNVVLTKSPQNKKQEKRMTIYCVWQKIRKLLIQSAFCVSVKLCIFSVLARLFVCCRKNWTAKTTMLSIPILTVCKTLHDKTGDSRPFHTGRLSQKNAINHYYFYLNTGFIASILRMICSS